MMMIGGYVCDLLVHSIASLNNRYIPQSFTNQYEFLKSCKNKPEDFSKLYLKINKSKKVYEIRNLCADIICLMKDYLGVNEKSESVVNADGLAEWYEEMINDWRRVRGFAQRNEKLNVRGWATKLQNQLEYASERYGIKLYELLDKFDEDDMIEFSKYADKYEMDIRKILTESGAKLNEFDSVDKFINAFEHDKLRL